MCSLENQDIKEFHYSWTSIVDSNINWLVEEEGILELILCCFLLFLKYFSLWNFHLYATDIIGAKIQSQLSLYMM